jgi:hypothetical protein
MVEDPGLLACATPAATYPATRRNIPKAGILGHTAVKTLKPTNFTPFMKAAILFAVA